MRLSQLRQARFNVFFRIEQAKGVVARTHRVGVDAAFDRMRDYPRHHHHHRLSDVARDVVAEPSRHPELTAAR